METPIKEDSPKTFKEEFANEKLWAASAYVLFFLPMLAPKKTDFLRFHTRQGFNLFLSALALVVVGGVLTVLTFGIFGLVMMILQLGLVALVIYGIVNSLNGEKKELPLIGKYEFVKF
ncbi:DUF4870 domain-containing protein [bacterium]|nr:DUF4870 domain-containing protein [bacterium]